MIRLNVSLLQTQSISTTPAVASCIDLAMLLALAGLADGLVLQYYFSVFRLSSLAKSRLKVRSTICYQKCLLLTDFLPLCRTYPLKSHSWMLLISYLSRLLWMHGESRWRNGRGTSLRCYCWHDRSITLTIAGILLGQAGFLLSRGEPGDFQNHGATQSIAALVIHTVMMGILVVHGTLLFNALVRPPRSADSPPLADVESGTMVEWSIQGMQSIPHIFIFASKRLTWPASSHNLVLNPVDTSWCISMYSAQLLYRGQKKL